MVQVLQARERQPSFLDSLLAGAGQAIPEAVEGYFSNKKQQQILNQQNQALERAGFGDLIGLPEKAQTAAIAERLKGDEKRKTKEEASKRLSDLLNKTESLGSQLRGEKPEEEIYKEEPYKPKYSDEFLAQLSIDEPAAARELSHKEDVERRESTERMKMKQKERLATHAEKQPLIKEILEKGNRAREAIRSKEGMIDLVNKGNLNDPTVVAFLDMLPNKIGQRFLSDDTATYKSAMVDDFNGIQNTFPGQIRVKEIEIWEDKLANLYLSDSQKKSVLNNRINALKSDVIKLESAEYINEKYPDVGLLKFNKLVNEETAKRTAALGEMIKSEIDNIINQAEMRKKIPLDSNDSEDAKIMKQILMDAGGNKEKALELAKKKGYSFKGYEVK